MTFNEQDNFNYADYQESIFNTVHDGLLTERAELLKATLCVKAKTQSIAGDILDVAEEIVDYAGEILAISMSLYTTGQVAQIGGGDLLDVSYDAFASSDYLQDIVRRADASAKNLLAVVRELIGKAGGRHEQG